MTSTRRALPDTVSAELQLSSWLRSFVFLPSLTLKYFWILCVSLSLLQP